MADLFKFLSAVVCTVGGFALGGPAGATVGFTVGMNVGELAKKPGERTFEITNDPKQAIANTVYNTLDKTINGERPYESYDKKRERAGREEFLNESYKYSKQYETEQRLEENFREKSDWISRLKLEQDKKDFLRKVDEINKKIIKENDISKLNKKEENYLKNFTASGYYDMRVSNSPTVSNSSTISNVSTISNSPTVSNSSTVSKISNYTSQYSSLREYNNEIDNFCHKLSNSYDKHVKEMNYISKRPLMKNRIQKYKEEEKRFNNELRQTLYDLHRAKIKAIENSSAPGLDSVLSDMANPNSYGAGVPELIGNVISTVAETISNGLVNPSANSDTTNRVLEMASNIPTAIDLLTSGPSGIVSTIANGALGEVNNSLNERSTARQMINGIAGATALIATRVAPRVAPGIGNAITAIETLELINNLHVERVRNATSEQLEEMLEDSNRIAMNGVM
jgi:hypothetical protein